MGGGLLQHGVLSALRLVCKGLFVICDWLRSQAAELSPFILRHLFSTSCGFTEADPSLVPQQVRTGQRKRKCSTSSLNSCITTLFTSLRQVVFTAGCPVAGWCCHAEAPGALLQLPWCAWACGQGERRLAAAAPHAVHVGGAGQLAGRRDYTPMWPGR